MYNGDDGSVIGFADALPPIEEIQRRALQLGFEYTIELHTDPRKLTFCRMRPWPTIEGTVFGPDIFRVCSRIGATVAAHPDVYGSAMSMVNLTAHIPVLCDLVNSHLRLSRPGAKTSDTHKFRFRAERAHKASRDVWDFIYAIYGCTKSDVTALEMAIRQVDSLPAVLPGRLLRPFQVEV